MRLDNRPTYRDGVKGVVLDWSGTTADAYVIAPAIVFVDVFADEGIEISMEEARGPMGLRKDLHIQALLDDPVIRARWTGVHGRQPGQDDLDRMFSAFVPKQIACLPNYATLLPGVVEMAGELQRREIKIGMSTGFTRAMVDVLLAHAKEQGFHPDATVAGDEVVNGARPKPFMVFRNMDLLDLHPVESVVKVDDTASGVGEGINAGCWAVGIAGYSNYLNVNSLAEAAAIEPDERLARLEKTREILAGGGAHYVIDEPIELIDVIDDINARLAVGERP